MKNYNVPELPLEPDEGEMPRCPICGAEAYTIFIDKYGDVVGCDDCMTTKDAYDWEEENRD